MREKEKHKGKRRWRGKERRREGIRNLQEMEAGGASFVYHCIPPFPPSRWSPRSQLLMLQGKRFYVLTNLSSELGPSIFVS